MNSILRWFIGAYAVLCASGAPAVADALSPWEELEAPETHRVVEANADPMIPRRKARSFGNWYGGAHIGATVMQDTKFLGPDFQLDYEFDTGFAFGASVGYAYDFGLRFETESTYRVSQAEQLDFLGSTFSGSGNIDTLSLMLNSWFDLNFLGAVVPYFGGGAGITYAWSTVGSEGFLLVEAEDSAFAWQAGGGIAYEISDGLFMSLDYRFFRTIGSFEFDDPFYTGPVKANYRVHNIIFGLRGFF